MTLLKYLSLFGATLAGLAGYFFPLKRDVPGGGVAPTNVGWVVVAALAFAALATATLTRLDARRDRRRASAAEAERDETHGRLEQLQAASERSQIAAREAADQTRELNAVINALAPKIMALGDAAVASRGGRDAVRSLVRDPALQRQKSRNAALSEALDGLAVRLGGKRETAAWLSHHALGDFSPDALAQVATFGLKWFGPNTSDLTRRAVADAIRGLEADVLVMQEFSGEEALKRLLAEVPDYDGQIAAGSGPLRLAMVHQRGCVTLIGDAERIVGEGFDGRFDRPPFVQRLRIDDFETDLVAVHFKSPRQPWGDDPQHAGKRTTQARTVAKWLAARPDPASVLVVGTFHATSDAPELAPLRDAGAVFATAELPLDAETFRTPGRRVGVVSHVVLWGEAKARYVPGSVRVRDLPAMLPLLSQAEVSEMLSDHNPLSVVLRTQTAEPTAKQDPH